MNHVYFIAECGQNHNGDLELARKLIERANIPIYHEGSPLPGVDAVKFVKRDLENEMTCSMWRRDYESPHAFGKTYGDHRKALELNDLEHLELYEMAKSRRLDFVETICNPGALSILKYFTPDRLKIASRDLDNLPLLRAVAETGIPVILSTGMAETVSEIDEAVDQVLYFHSEITILHCLSQYPSRYEELNLLTIPYLVERYPEFSIGYSDHTTGILAPAIAAALGAKVIEKHITLDRAMKGTDQQGSLDHQGLVRVVRDIRNVEKALGSEGMNDKIAALQASLKLRRSIAAARSIRAGETIQEEDLVLLSPGTGTRWKNRLEIIGTVATKDIERHELIEWGDYR